MTACAVLAEAKKRLSGLPTASLDAEILLADLLGITRSRLAAHPETEISGENTQCFFMNVEKRRSGVCVAYLTGKKAFRAIELAVTPSVLVPRPETETLVEAALSRIDRMGAGDTLRVLDLCTGSGAVALALLDERPALNLTASDLSDAALACARENYHRLYGAKTPCSRQCTFIQSNLFSTIKDCFHLIVSNPPYIPHAEIASLSPEVQSEPRIALDGGADGLELIRAIIACAPNHLEDGGSLILEAAPGQMEDIKGLFAYTGFSEISVIRDLSCAGRVIAGRFFHPA